MRAIVFSLIVLSAIAAPLPMLFHWRSERGLQLAASAYAAERWREAREIAEQAATGEADTHRAAALCTLASARLHDENGVLEWSSRAGDRSDAASLEALLASAEVLLNRGRPEEAESRLRRVLTLDPQCNRARERLVYLLAAEGRTWDAVEPLTALVRDGRFVGDHLLMLASIQSQVFDIPEFKQACLETDPHSAWHLLPAARLAMLRNENRRARELLEQLVEREPQNIEAQAWLGRLLAESGNSADFAGWYARRPRGADAHPETWFAIGYWAQHAGQTQAAARCYWEALRHNPQHTAANYQLGQILSALGRTADAAAFADRARHLATLEDLLKDIVSNPSLLPRLVAELEQLGRVGEAAGWCALALRQKPAEGWPRPVLARLHRVVARETSLSLESADPTRKIDLSHWPPPRLDDLSTRENPGMLTGSTLISFIDRAADAGLDFRYYNGSEPGSGVMRMFEFSGGGGAVLDYDGDLWPDIYLTQGCRWPAEPSQREHLDRLFRNRDGNRFEEIGRYAGIEEAGFGQGATVADVNNDGFPDLYVGNIGPNKLYLNQGDGTFIDATELSGTACGDWTSSCVMADFNADGLPDLFTATYLAGADAFTRQCENEGQPVQCSPVVFPAADDHLFQNLGDGRFAEVSREAGIQAADGKGLGVVAGDFDGSRRLSIFVANDTTANFFFLNRTAASGETPMFAESALLAGLAFDEQGRAQACMGVAAGDANLDGRLDLFVTNFFREANTLYVQQQDGGFRDETRPAQLRDAGFDMLGWGTQFIDADLDGLSDLLVLNGHVNDFSSAGVPFRMPPQFYRNLGEGRFAEFSAGEPGGYFDRQYLGRALARLDWNRDGFEDACATHVDAPVALLTNESSRGNHFLAIRLVGVESARDAIGTTVTVVCDGHAWTRQLTAGDGFQASNERLLVFGLARAEVVDKLVVRWPAGAVQTFAAIAVDKEWLMVEEYSWPIELPRLAPRH